MPVGVIHCRFCFISEVNVVFYLRVSEQGRVRARVFPIFQQCFILLILKPPLFKLSGRFVSISLQRQTYRIIEMGI